MGKNIMTLIAGISLITSLSFNSYGQEEINISYEYDSLGRVARETREGGNYIQTTKYSYDNAGNLISEEEEMDREKDRKIDDYLKTTYKYDKANNLIGSVVSDKKREKKKK